MNELFNKFNHAEASLKEVAETTSTSTEKTWAEEEFIMNSKSASNSYSNELNELVKTDLVKLIKARGLVVNDYSLEIDINNYDESIYELLDGFVSQINRQLDKPLVHIDEIKVVVNGETTNIHFRNTSKDEVLELIGRSFVTKFGSWRVLATTDEIHISASFDKNQYESIKLDIETKRELCVN